MIQIEEPKLRQGNLAYALIGSHLYRVVVNGYSVNFKVTGSGMESNVEKYTVRLIFSANNYSKEIIDVYPENISDNLEDLVSDSEEYYA